VSTYAVIALALGLSCYRRGNPLTLRHALEPLWGRHVEGPLGLAVDSLAIVATLFGVATSLGLGVTQINAGLTYLYDAPNSLSLQLALIGGITMVATLSVVSGVGKGIRLLSEANMLVAGLLLLFVLLMGPTSRLLNLFFQDLGIYLQSLPNTTFYNNTGRRTTIG
jgi:choline/glycine/proline betaine transport protein